MERHNVPYGGFDIFMFGDFRQLPPVGARPMYATNMKLDESQRVWETTREKIKQGLQVYYNIDQVLTLRINERQKVKSKKDETPEEKKKRMKRARQARRFRRHLDQLGNGTCSGNRRDINPYTKYSDTKWWRKVMLTDEEEINRWMDDDRVVTLVHTNEEALKISAEYAVRKTRDPKVTLWQWPAHNACDT